MSRSSSGNTPRDRLDAAVYRGDIEAVRELVDGGHIGVNCDLSGEDHYGYTALHRACEVGHRQVAAFLLSAGADRSLHFRDAFGRTAVDYATKPSVRAECEKWIAGQQHPPLPLSPPPPGWGKRECWPPRQGQRTTIANPTPQTRHQEPSRADLQLPEAATGGGSGSGSVAPHALESLRRWRRRMARKLVRDQRRALWAGATAASDEASRALAFRQPSRALALWGQALRQAVQAAALVTGGGDDDGEGEVERGAASVAVLRARVRTAAAASAAEVRTARRADQPQAPPLPHTHTHTHTQTHTFPCTYVHAVASPRLRALVRR
jgi:hypothetical protein